MHFCLSCQQLNISLKSFISHPGSDDNPQSKSPIHLLGTFYDLQCRTETCDVCRLLVASFQSGPLRNSVNLIDTRQIPVRAAWINALGSSKEQRTRSAAMCILVWPELPKIDPETVKLVIRAVSAALPQYPHFGRLPHAAPALLDFETIQAWLHKCINAHSSCREVDDSDAARPTKHFLVIDVEKNCVVQAQEGCRYVALSYVWGDAHQLQLSQLNIDYLTKVNGLMVRQPTRTIRDAMEVTRKLKERYLWVDALCIVQDSEVERRQCIEDMDRIYAQSLLTIVAGTCTSADDPLPGVTAKRSCTLYYQQVSPSLSLSAHFDFKDHLADSVYNSRAWTFQEFHSPRRLLVFANNGQVYFSCQQAVYSEEVVSDTRLEPDAAMYDGAEIVRLHQNPSRLWSTYRRAVIEYTSRKMTKENDILNAFCGILRTLTGPQRSLEGMPVSILDLALLWQPKERLRRRAGFASWSWAGWVGQVQWFDDRCLSPFQGEQKTESDQVDAWVEAKTWIVWYTSWGIDPTSLTYLNEGPARLRKSTPQDSAHVSRFPGHPWNFLPDLSLLPRLLENETIEVRNGCYLQFWTISAYFEIRLDDSPVVRYTSSSPEHTGNGLRLFLLRDRSGQHCGWVLLEDSWVGIVVQEREPIYEFVMLSEGRCPPGLQQPHETPISDASDVEEFREFNAMMLVWQAGIAERAGLGRVKKDALSQSCCQDARWKEIVLG